MNSQLTPSIVKDRLKSVKNVIRDKLKVDSGTQNTNDIIAVANGYKNYHAVKANENKSFYTIATNLGDNDNHMIVEKDVGYFEYDYQAQEEAETIIKNCKSNLTWKLLKFGVDTGFIIKTSNTPNKGLAVNVTLFAENYEQIEYQFEQISDIFNSSNVDYDLLRTGHEQLNFDETEGFNIQLLGNEFDVISDVFFMDTEEFIIFDDTGIIENGSEDKIIRRWHDITTNKKSDFYNEMILFGTLRKGESVTKDYALNNDHKTYYAISTVENSSGDYDIISGEIMDVIDTVKTINNEFALFVELENKD